MVPVKYSINVRLYLYADVQSCLCFNQMNEELIVVLVFELNS